MSIDHAVKVSIVFIINFMSIANHGTYFPTLTGIRAIAAYMVYLHHYNPLRENLNDSVLSAMINELHIGVTLFFVLSGFLIGFRYSELNNFNFRNYMVNRIARIYPMYFLLTTLTFLVYAILKDKHELIDVFIYLSNITFLKGLFADLKFTGIAQGWSLTIEETFYLLAPLFFFLINRSRISLVLLPIMFVLLGTGLVYLFKNVVIFGFFSTFDFMFLYTFFGRCTEFFIGIALAIYFKHYNQSQRNTAYFTYTGILVIIINIFILTLFKREHVFSLMHPIGKVVNAFILPLTGIAVLYYGLITEKSLVSRILSSNIFVLLGKSSYIFYLIHLGIFTLLINKFSDNPLTIFILLNLLSVLMFRFIEEPLNNFIRNRFRKQTNN